MQNLQGSLIVVSGFSGAGKGSLMKNLIKRSDRYALSVSMTTRVPRKGEVDGKDYFFSTTEEFEQKIREGGLLEHAKYVEHYYGTPRDYVEEKLSKGKDVILEIDAQGGKQIREIMPSSVLVFVVTPSVKELVDRLQGRGTEEKDVILQRISRAREEVHLIDGYDYLVVNDDRDRCTDDLEAIIRASHLRTKVNASFVSEISGELDRFFTEGSLFTQL